jgi:hypothetical protein
MSYVHIKASFLPHRIGKDKLLAGIRKAARANGVTIHMPEGGEPNFLLDFDAGKIELTVGKEELDRYRAFLGSICGQFGLKSARLEYSPK